jgi:uroporphyrinogen-III decarboxylase
MVLHQNWLTTELTCRERALRAIKGLAVDRPAAVNPTSNINITLMDQVDAPFPLAHREADKMARLAATGHTVLGFDTIMPAFSIIQRPPRSDSRSIGWKRIIGRPVAESMRKGPTTSSFRRIGSKTKPPSVCWTPSGY